MKKYLSFAAMALLLAATSCDKENDDPNVDTKVYLSLDSSTLVAGSDGVANLSISLSANAAENLSVDLTVTGADCAGQVEINPNPALINAGDNATIVSVSVAGVSGVTEPVTVTIEPTGLPKGYKVAETVSLTILPEGTVTLTEEQQALVEGYKTLYGIDLMPWLGSVSLEGNVEEPGSGSTSYFEEPRNIELKGSTLFTLNEESTETEIILDMVSNPMGMAAYMHDLFRNVTVADEEYFANEDSADSLELMELIGWNKDSAETFDVKLKGLKITNLDPATGKGDIEFVVEGDDYVLNSKGEPIYCELLESDLLYSYHTSWIPFEYKYSAWDRMLGFIEAGNPTALEVMLSYTASPASYLGWSSVLEDEWMIDEEEDGVANLYVEPKGTVDFNNGKMTFEFPFDHTYSYGYSRVKVTYTVK